MVLDAERVVFGFVKSPQYAEYSGEIYTYNFGSSGIASSAGKLELVFDGEVIDEVCWGKLTCAHENPAFSTKVADNKTLLRCMEDDCEQNFIKEQYYPEISDVILRLEPEIESAPSCNGLIITEILSYFADSADEQFVEISNVSAEDIDMSYCALRYKNKNYFLSGILPPAAYLALRGLDVTFTKNPTTYNIYQIVDLDGNINDEVILPHGQKKSTSYALFDIGSETEQWLITYAPTPGMTNGYQQFQTCEAGKEINPETGNCVKSAEETTLTICPEGKYLNLLTGRCNTIKTTSVTACKDGYYRNPLTGRCKKNATTSTLTECKEGYERNPGTNRCRKNQENTGTEYPIKEVPTSDYANPEIFIAGGAVVALIALGCGYAAYQYRKEIKRFILKICRRNAS